MAKIEKITLWILGIQAILLLAAVIQLGAISAKLDGKAVEGSAAQKAPAAAQPAPAVDMEELMGDDPVKGDANAPVTIVEWSDFECPFCARFYTDTLSQIERSYIESGKVKLVYRDFPLSAHPQAQKAAEASECADEQDRFWEMHNILFERGVAGGVAAFKGYAKEIGLNEKEFAECLDSGKTASEIQQDMRDGTAAGIRGTPGFIINGKVVSGAQPYAAFAAAIEEALGT